MPQKRNSSEPPKVMTWKRALPVLILCVVFDALRLMFEMFWFFGPALVAIYCTVKGSETLSTVTFGLLGTGTAGVVCSSAAIAAGIVGAAVIESFGVMMAMATGLAGWLTIGIILIIFNRRIFEENALWFAASLLVSEIPIVGSIPAMTIVVWKMYSTQIKIEKAVLKKYEEEQKAAQLRERRQQEAQLMQLQAAQLASADVY